MHSNTSSFSFCADAEDNHNWGGQPVARGGS